MNYFLIPKGSIIKTVGRWLLILILLPAVAAKIICKIIWPLLTLAVIIGVVILIIHPDYITQFIDYLKKI